MRVLVVGSKGSMGRRYVAILRYLKEEVLEADLGDLWWEWAFDRVIIATPTDRHWVDLDAAITRGKPILCEKPISKDPKAIQILADMAKHYGVDVRMCSNWKYAINLALTRAQKIAVEGEMEIEYKYFRSGGDGFFWDMIQPIFLAGRLIYNNHRPAFKASVNGIELNQGHFEESYVIMISEWLYGDKSKLWSLEDALKANQKVELAMGLAVSEVAGEINFGKVTI